MTRLHTLFVMIAGAGALVGCAEYDVPAREPLTLERIIEMSGAETPVEDIVREVESSRTIYRLYTADVLKLHEAGVDHRVIDTLLETHYGLVRRGYWRPYYYDPYWHAWPHYTYWYHHGW